MLSRALIVLLVVLNAGVALWWATRPSLVPRQDAGDATPVEPASGVARLQLLREAPARAIARAPTATDTPANAAAAVIEPPVGSDASPAARCYAIGPFSTAQSLAAARSQLQSQAATLRTRETTAATPRGWRVVIPPLADRAAALATAERLKTAAIEDYFVMSNGDDANGIALGRYGAEASARQREATLRAAGFAAQAEPIGGGDTSTWLELAGVNAAFDASRARTATSAARADLVDCATLR